MQSSDPRGFVEASDPGQRCAARASDLDKCPKRNRAVEGLDSSAFSIRKKH